MFTSAELRKKYIAFFESKGHKAIPSASLIPENDPTVLFTTAGMHPLVPYLMGQPHPEGDRLVDAQKCVRTSDIEEAGDNRHLTFFEMLGNWSLGDYFKKEAIEWSYEFLTDKKWLGLDPRRLYITVFRGEAGIERDEESIKIWQEQFKKHEIEAKAAGDGAVWSDPGARIFALPKDDNFWEMGGETGPCGPAAEIFYDTNPKKGYEKKTFGELTDEFRFLEIWNNVFMSYNKLGTGKYELLKQHNVDTGMGIERTLAALNGNMNVFETELFAPIIVETRLIASLPPIASLHAGEREKSERIIADHIKAAVLILADDKKLVPSNVERGYVLRRLIRRAVRHGKKLGIKGEFTVKIAETVIDMYKDVYGEVGRNKEFIFSELKEEEKKFEEVLERAIKRRNKRIKIAKRLFNNNKEEGDGKWIRNDLKAADKNDLIEKTFGKDVFSDFVASAAFVLETTYGYPHDLFFDDLKSEFLNIEFGLKEIISDFENLLKKHRELSRTASAGMFKSGLADNSEMTARLHTATHLLQAALREILGNHVEQRGSNITPERLRFDFSHPEKMSAEQIKQAENRVNEIIGKDLPVIREEMSLQEAKASGALGLFDTKYSNKVSVYTIKDGDKIFSKEICAGPHIEHTGQMGKFKIQKEESSSQGIRRIKAVVEN